MATFVFAVVGATIGFYTGGPAGAYKGFQIGAVLGSAYEQSQAHYYTNDMGRSNDLKVTVASYGTSIPQCWGLTKPSGIITWGTDLQEHEHDESSGGGGSGGPSVTTRVYSYTFSVAVVLCKGAPNTVNHVEKIVANDLVLYDSTDTAFTKTNILGIGGGVCGISVTNPNGRLKSFRHYYGTEDQPADPVIISLAGNTDIPAGSDNPAFRGTAYVLIDDMDLTDFGDRPPNFNFRLNTGTVHLDTVLKDIFAQVGINTTTQVDFSLITGIQVTGLILSSRIDAKTAIQGLLDAYHVDLVDVDGLIRAVPRGGAPTFTVTYDDMGAQIMGSGTAPPTQRLVKTRLSELSLPRHIDVGYFSTSTDLQSATQPGDRQSCKSTVDESVSYPLTLEDTQARQLADRIINLRHLERDSYATNIMPYFISIIPTDVGWLQVNSSGLLRRVRILEAEEGLMGEIRTKLVLDDDAVLTQTSLGPTPTGGLPYRVPVATTFFAWSGKELRDQDGISAGFYVVATGADGWAGCTVLMSTNGGSNYTAVGAISSRSVWGTASTALGSSYTANTNGFDATNTVRVSVNGTLNSTDESQVLSGQGNYGLLTQSNQSIANASDYEVLGWASASIVSAGVYDISDLLRSQRSTAKTGHTSGDVFVNITNSAQRIPVASKLVGTVVKVKCVSAYADPSTVTAQDVYIAAPTAPYATSGDASNAANAVRTPYFRVRGYENQPSSVGSTIDDTYFFDSAGTAGSNKPSGVTNQYWEEASLSPIDITYYFANSGQVMAKWMRINLVNSTASSISFNWWAGVLDNYLRVRLDGSFISSNDPQNTTGTASVAANSTVLLELFYVNHNDNNSGAWDPANPTVAFFKTNALQQGLKWTDAGK